MKRIFTIAAALLITASVWAQAPQKMSYQAVVRNATNNLVTSQAVGMQISVLQGGASGTPVYVETQTPTTNANGLVSLEIGMGTVVSGDFTTIDWANDTYFIKTETDPTGGTSYTITGTTQLMSVPYALHSRTADSITGTVNYTETDPIFGVSVANGITAADTVSWNNKLDVEMDSSITNEIQILSISNDTIILSNGGYAKLPAGFDGQYSSLTGAPANVSTFTNDAGYLTTEVDGSVTNELQTISKSGSVVTLSNSGGSFTDVVNDADADSTNELQSISLSNDSLYLSNGNNVDLSTIDNGSWTTSGNAGTIPGTDFIGTTDNKPIILKANNNFVGKIGPGSSDLFLGYQAGNSSVSIGSYFNIGIGFQTMKNATTNAQYNTSLGYQALMSLDSGSYNTATGFQSLRLNSKGNFNTSYGALALSFNSTGNSNTATGFYAVGKNTTGNNNSGFGYLALSYNTTGNQNTAMGSRSLYNNTTGSDNVATGYQSLRNNTTGTKNIASGTQALYSNTTGYWNVAIGHQSLYSNTTGVYNVGIGYQTSYSGTTGTFGNVAIGYKSLYSNTGGLNNAVGYYSLRNNTTGASNQAYGAHSQLNNTTGTNNSSFGVRSLYTNTTGSCNTALGSYAGYQNNFSYSTAIGYNAQFYGSNQVRIGISSISSIGGYAGWSNVSDKRFKTNIQENITGLDFIMKLRPVSYNLDMDAIAAFNHTPDSLRLLESEALKAAEVQTGFIAQEVEAAAQSVGFAFHGVDAPKNENDHYGLRYAEFVVPIVKGMQEQQQLIIDLKKDNKQLQQDNEDLKKALELLVQRVSKLESE